MMNSADILTSLRSEERLTTIELPESSQLEAVRHTSETIKLPDPSALEAVRHESSETQPSPAPVAEQKPVVQNDVGAHNGAFATPHPTKLLRKKNSSSLSGLSEEHGRELMSVSSDAETESEPDSDEEENNNKSYKY